MLIILDHNRKKICTESNICQCILLIATETVICSPVWIMLRHTVHLQRSHALSKAIICSSRSLIVFLSAHVYGHMNLPFPWCSVKLLSYCLKFTDERVLDVLRALPRGGRQSSHHTAMIPRLSPECSCQKAQLVEALSGDTVPH